MAQSSREIYWSAVLADFRRSGMTPVQFSTSRRISLHPFRTWLYRLRPGLPARRPRTGRTSPLPSPVADPPAFLPVHVRPLPSAAVVARHVDPPPPPLEPVLGERCRLRVPAGFDPATLHRLLDALEEMPAPRPGGLRSGHPPPAPRRPGGAAVIDLPPTVRIFLATAPADMRRGFDGLAALTTSVLAQDPLSGHLFVFRNRRGDRLKILYWDRDGLAIWAKRLERGAFRFPAPAGGRVEVTPAEMAAILEGIDLSRARRQRRFALPAATPSPRGDQIL